MEILFQDADLILCLKDPGQISEEPGLPALLRERTGAKEVFCVHRLDRETGGLMVYALTKRAAAGLSLAIVRGELRKEYLAVTQGRPGPGGELRDLLYRDRQRNKSYVVDRPRKGVKEGILQYEPIGEQDGLCLLRVSLETGRSHQIRVQFASRGFPLLGDLRYGSRNRDCPLALWAHALAFPHPVTGETVAMRAAPPREMPWVLFPSASE